MKVGAFGVRFSSKKELFSVGSKKKGIFFDMDSQKWGSFSVQKCNFKPKFADFMLKYCLNFSKCAQSALKFAICIYNLILKWKRGHWVCTEEKGGLLGVRSV